MTAQNRPLIERLIVGGLKYLDKNTGKYVDNIGRGIENYCVTAASAPGLVAKSVKNNRFDSALSTEAKKLSEVLGFPVSKDAVGVYLTQMGVRDAMENLYTQREEAFRKIRNAYEKETETSAEETAETAETYSEAKSVGEKALTLFKEKVVAPYQGLKARVARANQTRRRKRSSPINN